MPKIRVDAGDGGGCSPGAYYREPNPAKIDLSNADDVTKWALLLEVSEKELHELVSQFGPFVKDIRRGRRKEAA